MIAFPAVGWAIQAWGWRAAWLGVGAALIAILAPAAWLLVGRGPEVYGLQPDGDDNVVSGFSRSDIDLPGYAWTAAVATPAFWIFAIGAALYGLVASGIGLFNESILAERGFGADIYYQSLAVTALTGLAGNFLGGWVSTRIALGRLLAASLAILTAGLAALPHVSATWHIVLWAASMGFGGGLVTVLFFAVWPRVFGRRHLGRIQGAAQAITVVASAVGPLFLAWCVDRTGSYAAMFQILAAVIAAIAVAALLIDLPPPFAPVHPRANPELSS
jgi:MFS family permease